VSDIQKAREIETMRYMKRIEELNAEEQQRVLKIKSDAAASGRSQGGGILTAISAARTEKLKSLIAFRLETRRELAMDIPELGSERALDDLLAEMTGNLDAAFAGLYHHQPGISGAVTEALQARHAREVGQLKGMARRDIEILKREIALNLHKKPQSTTPVSLNTGGGPAVVNLGTIYGNVQQVIGTVGSSGNEQLAELLRRLADAINGIAELGDQRATYLEQVEFIARQAAAAPEERQRSVVQGVLNGLHASLENVAHVTGILAFAGPAIAKHFGFPWPF
jgi:hypothetical protein